eukprot:3763262-Rhodomonas_salina.2
MSGPEKGLCDYQAISRTTYTTRSPRQTFTSCHGPSKTRFFVTSTCMAVSVLRCGHHDTLVPGIISGAEPKRMCKSAHARALLRCTRACASKGFPGSWLPPGLRSTTSVQTLRLISIRVTLLWGVCVCVLLRYRSNAPRMHVTESQRRTASFTLRKSSGSIDFLGQYWT